VHDLDLDAAGDVDAVGTGTISARGTRSSVQAFSALAARVTCTPRSEEATSPSTGAHDDDPQVSTANARPPSSHATSTSFTASAYGGVAVSLGAPELVGASAPGVAAQPAANSATAPSASAEGTARRRVIP